MEPSTLQFLADLSREIGEVKGMQTIMLWVMSGAGALIFSVLGWLGHCVYKSAVGLSKLSMETSRLSAEVSKISTETSRLSAEVSKVNTETSKLSAEMSRLGAEVSNLTK